MSIDPKYRPDYLKYCREYAEKYRAEDPHEGAFWTVKQRFVFLYDLVIELQNQLAKNSAESEGLKPMRITFTQEEIWAVMEKHLNGIFKTPVEMETMVMYRDKNGTLTQIEDWDSIEVEVKPKSDGNHATT
jgi:hypothetical protein